MSVSYTHLIDKNSYNKGEAISLPGIYGWVSNDDEFNIAATGGDVGSIKIAVSYTHLDVYKRQGLAMTIRRMLRW